MGTSRADNIKKHIIGTNALRIVSEAKCPVITTKSALKELILNG
jgi:nucleotide-binding universal stress UspA family protein